MVVPSTNVTYLLDTSLLIASGRNSPLWLYTQHRFGLSNHTVGTSIVNVAEVMSFVRNNDWEEARINKLKVFLTSIIVFPVDGQQYVDVYADIDIYSMKLGRRMTKNDLWVAVSTKLSGATLTTDNHFNHLYASVISGVWIDPASKL